MTPFIYLLPIIVAIVLFIFFRTKVVWWEYLILIFPSMLLTALINMGMISSKTSDTEYYGNFAVEVRYYEDWDEWHNETCTRTYTDSDGNTQTETYDCSHRDYHSEKWKQVLNDDCEYNISEKEYNRLKTQWGGKPIFVDMHRDYYHDDGDMYYTKYDENKLHSKTVSFTHTYKNKIKNSYSIFGFVKIDKKEAIQKGLYDYPKLISNNDDGSWSGGSDDQNPFIGYKPTINEMKHWKFINGYYGQSKQFRTYLLFFYNKPSSIVKEQQSYWQGGNKNEMVMCIGLDSITNKIQWTDAFSWCDKPTFEVNFKSYMSENDTLNLTKLADWTEIALQKGYWKRKQFKDFDYINIELSSKQLLWLFIIIFLFNIGMGVYLILNEYEYDDDGNMNNGKKSYSGSYNSDGYQGFYKAGKFLWRSSGRL